MNRRRETHPNAARGGAWTWLLALGGFAALTLGMFGGVLFESGDKVLSNPEQGDLITQYGYWREFGFGQLRQGHLRLWNPHIFCGAPFFGLQSGLLYPLNGLFLILPLAPAINWTIALHVFLAGVFTYLWATRRGLYPLAAFVSGALFMFCGPHFLHIYAGHLPHLCAMIWAPLLFAAIDGVYEGRVSSVKCQVSGAKAGGQGRTLNWIVLGAFAVAMQVLGGHPQYVLYTAVAAAIYCILLTASVWIHGWEQPEERAASGEWRVVRKRKRALLGFFFGIGCICAGGAALSAVQILSGFHDLSQTWRGGGVSREWAATYSLPPENFLTLLAPGFFGGTSGVAYWGRWKFWEMTLFLGMSGLVLAGIGAIWADRRTRRCSVLMVLVLFILALGGYSPLFPILYKWIPGFGALRGSSKFAFLAVLFITLLAGIGLDLLIQAARTPREREDPRAVNLWWLPGKFIAALCGAGALLIPVAIALRSPGLISSSETLWYRAVLASLRTRAQGAMINAGVDPAYLLQTGFEASKSLLIAAGSLLGIALLLTLLRRARAVVLVISALAIVEVFVFAHSHVDTFDLSQNGDAELRAFLAEHPGDYRIFNSFKPNAAMGVGALDIWGYDPAIPARYLQLLTLAHCVDPAAWAQFEPRATPWLLDMFRLRFMFGRSQGQFAWREGQSYLPHVLLVQKYRVVRDPLEAMSAVTNVMFNPREEVILESNPQPYFRANSPEVIGKALDPGTQPSATVLETTTDSIAISADVKAPSILLITDNYVEGWAVSTLPQVVPALRALDRRSGQQAYHVMAANHCLCAIPLAAGTHHLLLKYLPREFVVGKWISIGAWTLLPVFLIGAGIKRWLKRSRITLPEVARNLEKTP